ncbi:MAG: hypothetical protein R3350_00165 [Saprospiraceae bacterium]|nr:hypothetical protein [Saprospiraceae bacterium]
MNFIDFLIGFTLMSAMPHFILGVYKGRIPSLFGFGPKANIIYALVNLFASIGLFTYKYGPEEILYNGIYFGALFVLILYFLLGKTFYRYFHHLYHEEDEQ